MLKRVHVGVVADWNCIDVGCDVSKLPSLTLMTVEVDRLQGIVLI